MNDFLLRMKSLLGDEFDEFLKFYNSDDFIKGLRVNTLKCFPEKLCSLLDFELKKTPFCDEGYYIPSDVKSIGNNQNKNEQNSQNKNQNNNQNKNQQNSQNKSQNNCR